MHKKNSNISHKVKFISEHFCCCDPEVQSKQNLIKHGQDFKIRFLSGALKRNVRDQTGAAGVSTHRLTWPLSAAVGPAH